MTRSPDRPASPSADRTDRSAAALRANLARRKAQARARADASAGGVVDDQAGAPKDGKEEDPPCP